MGKYIPNTEAEQKAMLLESGFSSFDDLFRDIPQEVKLKGELSIPAGLSELEKRSVPGDLQRCRSIPSFYSLYRKERDW